MAQKDAGPGLSRAGAKASVPPLALSLAWQTGYDYALSPERVTDPERLAEIVDDIWHAASFAPPKTTFEERVARRHGEMLAFALNSATTWHGTYPGGPVDWATGRVLTAGAS